MFDRLDRVLDRTLTVLSKAVAIVGALGIVALMLITVVAVFWRYVIVDPIFGIGDLSVLTLSIVAAASVCYGARYNAHVSVNVIGHFFGRNITRITDIVMRVLAITILLLACFALVSKACGFEEACITDNLSIEHRPFYYGLALSMFIVATHVFWQLIVSLKHYHLDDPNEPGD